MTWIQICNYPVRKRIIINWFLSTLLISNINNFTLEGKDVTFLNLWKAALKNLGIFVHYSYLKKKGIKFMGTGKKHSLTQKQFVLYFFCNKILKLGKNLKIGTYFLKYDTGCPTKHNT